MDMDEQYRDVIYYRYSNGTVFGVSSNLHEMCSLKTIKAKHVVVVIDLC